jgi:peptidyl-tRNA hydrolase, PTH1 family
MYLIVGLGNPGSEYKNTRHNVGFDLIDLLSSQYNIPVDRIKFKGICGDGVIGEAKVILLKPNTYMNNSGESVIEVVNFYKIPAQNVIVLSDDVSLDVGRLRIRSKGSAGGHNGIKSIISHLNTEEFPRLRVGIGSPKNNLIPFVLGKFDSSDRKKVDEVFKSAALAVDSMINENVEAAMNKYNGLTV